MKLIFVRHGQTDFNKQGIVQGQEKDVPLNEEGVRQVERTASLFTQHVDRIMSSPLKRASQTAEILGKQLQKPTEFRDEIKESSMGSLAGKTWPEIEVVTGDPKVFEKDRNLTFDYRPYGGESSEHMRARVAGFVDDMKEKHPDESILVVAHGGVIDTMNALYGEKEFPEPGNASVHEFDF